VVESEDVIDELDDDGKSLCEEGKVRKYRMPTRMHFRKPTSKRYMKKF
jgi:hypothetical protein